MNENRVSVIQDECVREGGAAIEERTFTHERKRSPEEQKEFASEKE